VLTSSYSPPARKSPPISSFKPDSLIVAPVARRSSSRLGITLMVCAMFLFAASDAIAKILTQSFHPVQIIWFRQWGLFLGVIVLLCVKGPGILKTAQPRLQITRGALVVFSSVLFVYAVQYVTLTDAVAASFVAPFFLTIAGAWFLKEPVGVRRWTAVFIGFFGALIVVRPGMGVIHPAAMLVVLAAALYATRQVIGRVLADTDNTLTTIAYTAITSSLLVSLALPLVWILPTSTEHWLLLLGLALSASMGEVLLTSLFRSTI